MLGAMSSAVVLPLGSGPPLRSQEAEDLARRLRQAESALGRSEARFSALIEHGWDALVLCAADGTVTYASASASRVLGYARGELAGRSWAGLVHPEDHPRLARTLEALRRAPPGDGIETHLRLRHRDGSWRVVEGASRSLLHEPAVGAVAHSFRDVSAEDRAREHLQRVFDLSPDLIAVLGFNGWFRAVNPAFEAALGFSSDELLGEPSVHFVHPDDRALTRTALHQVRAGSEVSGIENRLRCKDGGYRWFQWRGRSERSDELIYLVARDVTDQKLAAERLDLSERLRRDLADAMPQIVWTARPDGSFEYVSRRWSTYTGIPRRNMTEGNAIHPDDVPAARVHWARALASGESLETEVRLRRAADRSWRWHLAQAVPARGSGGQIVRWIGTATDIHDRKEAEAQLAEAQRIARCGSWSYDVDQDRMTWSPELYDIFGLDRDAAKLSYVKMSALLYPDEADATLGPYEHRRAIERPDRSVLVCQLRAELEAGEDGRPRRMFGTVQDITALEEKERAIERQAELLNLTKDAIVVCSAEDGRVEFWSRGAELLFGWNAGEVAGRDARGLLGEDSIAHEAARRHLLSRGDWNGEMRYVTKAGIEVVTNDRWTLVRAADGSPERILKIQTDITEHKKLETQFLRAQRLESLGTLASGVAHDLNNILAPILMAAPVLNGDLTEEARQSFLSVIENSAQRGAGLVRQVLTFARGAEGERVLLQPRHLLNEIVKIAEETFPRSIAVGADYAEDLWLVEGDPTHIHQVLLNLCVNARDAMPSGGNLSITAENFLLDESYASMTPGARPGPHVILSVRDNGAGISRSVVERIFDPFFTTKAAGKGTGLGLSTAIGLVKSHGGFITVASEPGTGSTFKVFLPAAPGQEEPLSSPGSDAGFDTPTGNGELILIVDDEPGILVVAETLLRNQGYRVLTAGDGTEAVAVFAAHADEVRVVFTDLLMPLMDGVTLIRTLRRMRPQLAVIASTGADDDDARADDLTALGIQACLRKPFNRASLLAALAQALPSPPLS